MRNLTTFFVFLSFISLSAQDYIPFIEGQKCWHIREIDNISAMFDTMHVDYLFLDEADTLTYNGMTYNYMRGGYLGGNIRAIMREDILNQRVYCIYKDDLHNYFQQSDSTEILLYDFSVTEGDTIIHYISEEQDSLYSVIANTEENEEGEKVIYYNPDESIGIQSFSKVVEGKGDVDNGPFGYFIHSSGPYNNDLAFYRDINCTPQNVAVENISSIEFSVFPNPSFGVLYLDVNADNLPSLIQVQDITGETIKRFEFVSEIDISSLAKGCWILSLFDMEGNQVGVEKIMVF